MKGGTPTKQETGNAAACHQEPYKKVDSVLTVRDDTHIGLHIVVRLLRTALGGLDLNILPCLLRFLFVQHHEAGRRNVKGLLEVPSLAPHFLPNRAPLLAFCMGSDGRENCRASRPPHGNCLPPKSAGLGSRSLKASQGARDNCRENARIVGGDTNLQARRTGRQVDPR